MSGMAPEFGARVEAAIVRVRDESRASWRTDPLRSRRLDGRERLGSSARCRPVRDQALRRLVRRPHARGMILCDLDGHVDRGHRGHRPQPRRATPRPTPTSTGTCPRSAGSCTPTRPSRSPGRPVARRSRASSPRWPTSSAGRSRSGPSRSSATTRSAGHRRDPYRAPLPRGAHAEPRAVHDRRDRRRTRSRPPSCSRTSPAPCTSPARPARSSRSRRRRSTASTPLPERLRAERRRTADDRVRRTCSPSPTRGRRSSTGGRRSASNSAPPVSRRASSARIRPSCSPSAATSGRTGSSTALDLLAR